MTRHALDRLKERAIGIDPQKALEQIRDAIGGDEGEISAETVDGSRVWAVRLSTAQIVFPIVKSNGEVVTVLSAGMDVETSTGRKVLERPRWMRGKEVSGQWIWSIGPDEQITEPGFYNITLDRHHSQPCDGPSVTSGVLRTMELHTPADVWAYSLLNPHRYEREETDALRLGKAMAAYVEGGLDEVAKHYLVLPADKPRRPSAPQIAAYERNGFWSDAAKEGAEFWAAVDADGRDPLTDDQIRMICQMGEALAKDPAVSVLMGGVPECTMAYRDEATGLWVLSRPDNVSFDGSVTDYKKLSTQGRPFTHWLCDRRIEQHGYHMQMALARDAMTRLLGDTPDSVGLVFQHDKPPYSPILRGLDKQTLNIGTFQNDRSLRRFAECLESGFWPGPGEDVGTYQMRDSLYQRLLEEMQTAGVAP